MSSGRKDLSGLVFSRLTVKSYSHTKDKRAFWLCVCECGKECTVRGKTLLNGDTKSCGCLRGESHGNSYASEYVTWSGIKDRCLNPRNRKFKNYGGRGIGVCDRWLHSFSNFMEDMGKKPSPKHTLDRMDNSKGYYKENCRWATNTEQANNRRSNVKVTIGGVIKTASEWAVLHGVPPGRALTRINKFKWNPEKAVTQKPRHITR